jgi:flagellar motor switch/type III secretory pathway protein FliN
LTIRLPDRMTSAASLSSLAPGTTLALGPLTEGMPVELRVADRLLARGELVQLGDRFAVLIESRADIADPVTAEDDQ